MKGITLLLITAAALAHANPARFFENGCPKDTSKLLPHQDCGRFFVCFRETKFVRECPHGLHFNAELELCDLPRNAKCNLNQLEHHSEVKLLNGRNENPAAICASENSEGVLFPHEKCNQFYKCSGRHLVAFDCPTNLLFNEISKMCDWPEKVDCDNRLISDDKEVVDNNGGNNQEGGGNVGNYADPSEAPKICAAENSDGVLVAHENCDRFYKCFDGHPVALNCPDNLLYNPELEYCDWPWNVNCGERTISDDKEVVDNNGGNNQEGGGNVGNYADPSEAPKICAAENSDGVLVAHENCDRFYKCFDGHPVALNCPNNLLYNPEMEYCDWPWNVNCGERTISDDKEVVDNNGGNNQEGGGNVGNYADPSEAPKICAAENSDGVLVAHENCNRFYKCFDGHPVALNYCPDNLLYNPELEYCDWPWNVNCGERTISDDKEVVDNNGGNNQEGGGNVGNYADPSEAPKICAAENSDGVLVAHENCDRFYKCFDGHPVALNCPDNLLYNPEMEYCDWPWNVNCGERTISDDKEVVDNNGGNNQEGGGNVGNNADPSEAPKICAAENSDGVLVAHENCDQFYKCFEGKPVAMNCPVNLFYNPEQGYCDWQFNVKCNNKVIPTQNNDGNGNNFVNQLCSGKDDDIIPHENCNQFYKCVHSHMEPMYCPPGLHFNTIFKVCDWPMNVDCGHRKK